MKFRIAFLFLVFFTGLFTSCNQTLIESAPVPTIEIINLQIPPELEHWMPELSQCANAIEGLGIYADIVIQSELDLNQADLVLRLGQRKESDPYVAVIGFEEITIIAGNEIQVATLSIETLRAIFSGELTNWADVPEIRQQEIEINQPIQTHSYPEGNILRELFSHSFLENEPIISDPIIYSTSEGLNRLLQENPYGITYLLRSHLMEGQDLLYITGVDPLFGQQYVLAVTKAEPEGKIKQLLLCLQITQ